MENRVTVYHAIPLCKNCQSDVSRVQMAAAQAGSGTHVAFSFWNRLKYGLKLLKSPVVVADGRHFSVLGALRRRGVDCRVEKKGIGFVPSR